MAGIYAGFLNSIVVVIKSAAYFINPLIIGFMIPDHVRYHFIYLWSIILFHFFSLSSQSQSEWNAYFLMISFITLFKIITFLIFGSGDLQPWAVVSLKGDSCANDSSTGNDETTTGRIICTIFIWTDLYLST